MPKAPNHPVKNANIVKQGHTTSGKHGTSVNAKRKYPSGTRNIDPRGGK